MASVKTGVNMAAELREVSFRSHRRPNVKIAIILNIITLCNRIAILIQLNNLELAKTLFIRADKLCKLINDPAMNDRIVLWSAMIKAAEGDIQSACTELLLCIGILGQLPHESQTWARYMMEHWNTAIEIMNRNSCDEGETSELVLRQLIDRYQETFGDGNRNIPRTADTTARTLYSLIQDDSGVNQSLVVSDRGASTTSVYHTALEAPSSNVIHFARDQYAANTNMHHEVNAQIPQRTAKAPEGLGSQTPIRVASAQQSSVAETPQAAVEQHATSVADPDQHDAIPESIVPPIPENPTKSEGPTTRVTTNQSPLEFLPKDLGIPPVPTINAELVADTNGNLDQLSTIFPRTQSAAAEDLIAKNRDVEHNVTNDHSLAEHGVGEEETANVSIVRHADQLAFDPTLKPDVLDALLNIRNVSAETPNGSSTESVYDSSGRQPIENSPDPITQYTSHTEPLAEVLNKVSTEAVYDSSSERSTPISLQPVERIYPRTEVLGRVEVLRALPENATLGTNTSSAIQDRTPSSSVRFNAGAGNSIWRGTEDDMTQQVATRPEEGSSRQPITGTELHQPAGITNVTDASDSSDQSDIVEPAQSNTRHEQTLPVSQHENSIHLSPVGEGSIHTQSDSNSTTASCTPVDNDAFINELLQNLLAEQEGTNRQPRSGSVQSNRGVRSGTSSRTLSRASSRTSSRVASRRSASSRTVSRASSRTLSRSCGDKQSPPVTRIQSTDNRTPLSSSKSDLYKSLLLNTELSVQNPTTTQSNSSPMRTYQEVYNGGSPLDAIDSLMKGLTSMNRSPRARPVNRPMIRSAQWPNQVITSPPRQQITSAPAARRANSILRERLTNKLLIAAIQRPAYYSNPVTSVPTPLSIPPVPTHALPSPMSPISPLDISTAPPFRTNLTSLSPILEPQFQPVEDNFADIANAAETIRQLSRRRPSFPFNGLTLSPDAYVNSDGESHSFSGRNVDVKPAYQAGVRRGSLELTLPTSPLRTHVEVDGADDDLVHGQDGSSEVEVERGYRSETEDAEDGEKDEYAYLERVRKRTQSMSWNLVTEKTVWHSGGRETFKHSSKK